MNHYDRINPLKKVTLASMVADQLRTLVLQGVYTPGDQLSEVELARRFGVSRGPVREGLQQLVHDGLLQSEAHRGVFLPRLSQEDIADIYVAREAIEATAARLIFRNSQQRVVGDELLKTTDAMTQAYRAGDWTHLLRLYLVFHLELVQASESRRLTRMYRSLLDETTLVLRQELSEPDDGVVDAHVRLAEHFQSDELDEVLARIKAGQYQSEAAALAAGSTDRKEQD
jgi:DNA-binding GntR family transcriptional regulator